MPLQDELAKLDAEIEARHAKELQQLEAASSDSSAAAAASSPAVAAQVASAVDGSADAADKASKYLKELSVGDAEVEDVAKAGKVRGHLGVSVSELYSYNSA